MKEMGKSSRQNRKNQAKTAWKENAWIGVAFILIGITGLLYGWHKGFAFGGLTWITVFAIIGLYSLLVLRREDY